MNTLIEKIALVPEIFFEKNKSTNAKNLAIQLFKDGRITDLEFETILKGFEKTIINLHGVSIDNSITIDGNISQSSIGQAAMDHDLKTSKIFWEACKK